MKLIPSLGVADITESINFYRGFLGFEVVNSYETNGKMLWAHLKSEGADLMLQELTEDQIGESYHSRPKCWVLYVSPENIIELHDALQRADYRVSPLEKTSYGSTEFFMLDPDGYELWISQPSV